MASVDKVIPLSDLDRCTFIDRVEAALTHTWKRLPALSAHEDDRTFS
jgi:hypothetical protein